MKFLSKSAAVSLIVFKFVLSAQAEAITPIIATRVIGEDVANMKSIIIRTQAELCGWYPGGAEAEVTKLDPSSAHITFHRRVTPGPCKVLGSYALLLHSDLFKLGLNPNDLNLLFETQRGTEASLANTPSKTLFDSVKALKETQHPEASDLTQKRLTQLRCQTSYIGPQYNEEIRCTFKDQSTGKRITVIDLLQGTQSLRSEGALELWNALYLFSSNTIPTNPVTEVKKARKLECSKIIGSAQEYHSCTIVR